MSRRTLCWSRRNAPARRDLVAASVPHAALRRRSLALKRLAGIAIVALAWLAGATDGWATDSLVLQVSSSADDATASHEGVQLVGKSLALGQGQPEAYHGVRFVKAMIPPRAKIISAHLQFRSLTTQYETPSVTILYGIAEDNATSFTAELGSVVKRALTASAAKWEAEGWKEGGWYDSADIAPIVQEIVDRRGWQAGNSLAFVLSSYPDSRPRDACQWDVDGSSAVKLIVQYEDLAEQPLVHWNLDEPSGSVLANSGAYGTRAAAKAIGKFALAAPGLVVDGGAALRFAGGYATPGHVDGINTGANMPVLSRTVELWFQPESVKGRQVLFEEGGGVRDLVAYLEGSSLIISTNNHKDDDGGGLAAPWGNPPVYVIAKGRIQPGVRYHVAAVFGAKPDSANGILRGYLNGVEFGASSGIGPLWAHNPVNLAQTRDSNRYHDNKTVSQGYPFFGVMDDVKIWGSVLSPTRLLENYGQGWGLLAHWTLDEQQGEVAYDSSGCENHLKLVGPPTLGLPAVNECGMGFHAQMTQATAPRSVGLDALGANGHDFTVALWVKPGELTGDCRPLFHKGADNYQRGPGIWLHPDSHCVHASLSTDYRADEGFDSRPLPADAWSHVAIVKSGNRFRCYINGQLDVDLPLRGASVGNNGPVYLGGNPWCDVANCQLDEVRVYHRALRDSEILEMAATGLSGKLAGHWALDEVAGTVAYDQATCGLHGSLQGAPELGAAGPYPTTRALSLQSPGDCVVVRHNRALAFGNSPFTLSCWVLRRSGGAANSDLIAKRQLLGATEYALRLTATNQVELVANQGQILGGSGPWAAASSAALDYDRWHHVAVASDGAAVTWYVDGQLDRSVPAKLVVGDSTQDVTLGGLSDAPLYGALHDVRIHRRALAHNEIAQLYGLVGWYRCEETAGNVVADASGAGRHGALVGTGVWDSSAREGQGCLRLEGNAYVEVPGVAPEGPHAAIAGWAKLQPVVGHGADLLNLGGSLVLRLDEASQGWGAVALAHNGATYDPASSGRFLAQAGWRHYAAVLNAELGTLDLYVDGIRRGTVPSQGAGSFANLVSRTVLGGDALGSSDYPLSGWIDDLRVYNRPLSRRELRRLYYQRDVTGPRIFEWYETR